MRVRRVLVGAVVAVAAVIGVSGMAGSQNGSDDYVLWNVTSGAGNQYFQLGDTSERQEYTGTAPWTLAGSPALMEVAATNGQPHFSGVRHGVKNTGEGQGGQDSISQSEVLVLSIGADLAPRQFNRITGLRLESQSGLAEARLVAKSNGQPVGPTRIFTIPRSQTSTVTVEFDGPFDTIEFSAQSGRYGILPADPATRFHLTSAQVVAPGQPVVSRNDDGDTAETTCLEALGGCAAKGDEVPIEQAFGEDEERKFLDVLFVGEGGEVFLQTVLTYTLEPSEPMPLPVSEIDFDPSDPGPFEPVTLCDSLPGAAPTAEVPACLRSLVATGNRDGSVTVVETYELAGDPRVRFG